MPTRWQTRDEALAFWAANVPLEQRKRIHETRHCSYCNAPCSPASHTSAKDRLARILITLRKVLREGLLRRVNLQRSGSQQRYVFGL